MARNKYHTPLGGKNRISRRNPYQKIIWQLTPKPGPRSRKADGSRGESVTGNSHITNEKTRNNVVVFFSVRWSRCCCWFFNSVGCGMELVFSGWHSWISTDSEDSRHCWAGCRYYYFFLLSLCGNMRPGHVLILISRGAMFSSCVSVIWIRIRHFCHPNMAFRNATVECEKQRYSGMFCVILSRWEYGAWDIWPALHFSKRQSAVVPFQQGSI